MKLSTAIIPAAGKGTRLMPLTAAVPKELMPLGMHPALHYTMAELWASQINRVIVVTHAHKSALSQYLDTHESHFQLAYTHQTIPRGLGHAVLQARHLMSPGESFALCLPDDIITGTIPTTQHLMNLSRTYGYDMAICVQPVTPAQTASYGIIAINHQLAPGIFDIGALVEKPLPAQAPSRYAIVGRYLLNYHIFDYLQARTAAHTGSQEIQLTDALQDMLMAGHKILAVTVPGTRYDIGTIPGWLEANLALSAQEPALASVIEQYIAQYTPLWPTTSPRPTIQSPGS